MVFTNLKVAVLAAALLASKVAFSYPLCSPYNDANNSGAGIKMEKTNCDVQNPTNINTVVHCDIDAIKNQVIGKSHWFPSEGHHELSLEISSTASRPIAVQIYDLQGAASKLYKVEPNQPACEIVQQGVGENTIRLWEQ